MCPFLYYMVRDFHVGAEKWIGYYAGLLLTGFWGANLATALFWGYLSDKYGRKAIMLFGLFVTSLSTVYLGLSTCYHDAMWTLVIQGACTGLIPVSKCSIGELAHRQQRIHNAKMALTQKRQRLLRRQQQQRRRQQSAEWEHGLDEKTMGLVYWAESETDLTMAVTANAHYDFASKGYSALVVALSLGASLGPLAGGVLTKKMIPGFEAFPYFAPCLFASAVGIFITGVVGLVLDETHPKWAKTSELEKTLENLSRFEQMEEVKEEKRDMSRGRSGYENIRNYEAAQAATKDTGLLTVDSESGDVVASLSVGGTATTTTLGTRPRLRQTAGAGTITPPTAVCTCHPHEPATDPVPLPPAYYVSSSSNNSNAHQPSSSPPSKLSPATELYLTLAIYTLLVLTSILGSEFVMLYTQSPTFRGGLEFSAKILGQILTLRGFLKLGFTLCGYPWIVKRIGLLKCLRLGVIAIGVFSVVGLGWFVPWAIFTQQESTRNRALVISSVDFIGSAGENALTYGNLPAGGRGGGEESEKTPVGMGVILFCLSLISIGDVLGYVSVLVLARINNNNYNNAGAGSGATGLGAQQGGSGVLWSVAQVSGNVMRLTGPVLAG
ncbi:hypothetical protein EC957_008446 [Mortierella hygrophila]|uniref:Uncharacterized protein n=1 Tax=Mortierella hygrophila TaxID=979708 RepID=A0A9P6FD48_9FUNG|nr:hypothetical protein EC957_008446 [Mortierella hygrophila]